MCLSCICFSLMPPNLPQLALCGATHKPDIEVLPDGPTPSRQFMWFRYLTASAACAAFLALAASGFVRTHFPEIMSALTPKTSEESPPDEPVRADGSSPSASDLAPEGVTPEQTLPASLLSPKAVKGHRAATTQPTSSNNPRRDAFAQELDRGIRKLAEGRYEIKRGTLELALGNLGLLARSVRVMPDARDGKPIGFRLFAIVADGPVGKLGLRNDDVLISINGLDIATAERVLDAYGKLKTAPHLVLGLIRERHEITQEYAIR